MTDAISAVLLVRGDDLAAAAAHDTAEGRAVRALLDAIHQPEPTARKAA